MTDTILISLVGDLGAAWVEAPTDRPFAALVAESAPRCSTRSAADLVVVDPTGKTLIDPEDTVVTAGLDRSATVRLLTVDEAVDVLGAGTAAVGPDPAPATARPGGGTPRSPGTLPAEPPAEFRPPWGGNRGWDPDPQHRPPTGGH